VIVELGSAPAAQLGGKAAGLARLVELGLPVPPAVVLPPGEPVGDPTAVVQRLGEPLAVRSSAIGEDSAGRSAAGQYETVLGVRAAGLAAAIAHVRGSTARAESYGADGPVAVVIQRQVTASRAGVAFSLDPVTRSAQVLIECAAGAPDAVVSGAVSPDRYWVGEAVRARADGPVRVLRDDEARELAVLVRTAEEGFGRPVDIEFCYEGRTLWLVQCRPITTL
jgi:phosphoenolpyruvate synthase/pyruvate phosphate dikinase